MIFPQVSIKMISLFSNQIERDPWPSKWVINRTIFWPLSKNLCQKWTELDKNQVLRNSAYNVTYVEIIW